eukprot:7027984-Prymnesium_polylepis.1
MSTMAADAASDGEKAEAAALFLAAHVLQPEVQRHALAAADVLLEQGDVEAATALFSMVDEARKKKTTCLRWDLNRSPL